MKNYLLLLFLILNHNTLAVGSKGNGADAVVCFKNDKTSQLKQLEVIKDLKRIKENDFYYGGGEGNIQTSIFSRRDIINAISFVELLDLYSEGISPSGHKKSWRSVLKSKDTESNFLSIAKLLKQKTSFGSDLIKTFKSLIFVGTPLAKNVDDAEYLGGIDDNCVLVQIAFRLYDRIEVNRHLFKLMAPVQQVATYLHEAIYALPEIILYSSRPIRPIVASIMTKGYIEQSSPLAYNLLLKEIAFDSIITQFGNLYIELDARPKFSFTGPSNINQVQLKLKTITGYNKGWYKRMDDQDKYDLLDDFKTDLEKCITREDLDQNKLCEYTYPADTFLNFQGQDVPLLIDEKISYNDIERGIVKSFYPGQLQANYIFKTSEDQSYKFMLKNHNHPILVNDLGHVKAGKIEYHTPQNLTTLYGYATFNDHDGLISKMNAYKVQGLNYIAYGKMIEISPVIVERTEISKINKARQVYTKVDGEKKILIYSRKNNLTIKLNINDGSIESIDGLLSTVRLNDPNDPFVSLGGKIKIYQYKEGFSSDHPIAIRSNSSQLYAKKISDINCNQSKKIKKTKGHYIFSLTINKLSDYYGVCNSIETYNSGNIKSSYFVNDTLIKHITKQSTIFLNVKAERKIEFHDNDFKIKSIILSSKIKVNSLVWAISRPWRINIASGTRLTFNINGEVTSYE